MRLQPIVTACLLAGITLLLYAFRLSAAPLTTEESAFNNRAQSIRAGTPPLFFHLRDEHWLQPIGVYANAAVRAIGGDDVSGRIASVVVGAIDVALVFLIAHLIDGARVGRHCRGRNPDVHPGALVDRAARNRRDLSSAARPAVALELAAVLQVGQRPSPSPRRALGLSVYSHPAGPLTAAFLWMLTLIVARRRNPRHAARLDADLRRWPGCRRRRGSTGTRTPTRTRSVDGSFLPRTFAIRSTGCWRSST